MQGNKFIIAAERQIRIKDSVKLISGFLILPENKRNTEYVKSLAEMQVIKVDGYMLDPTKTDGFTLIVEEAPTESVA